MRKREILLLFLSALFFAYCNRQQEIVLAEINGRTITAREFLQRYRAYLVSTSEKDNIVTRKKILQNMVNEILILEDAHVQGFDEDQVYAERLEDIKGQALLDAYAKTLLKTAMSVSESELFREFRFYNTKISARFVYAPSKSEAWALKKRLEAGESFGRVAKEVFEDPDLAGNGGYLGYFGWGEMERPLQDEAMVIPVGALSDPVRMKSGYGIVKVEDRIEIPLASEADFAKRKPELEKAIKQSKLVKRLTEEADKVEKELSPRFRREAVLFLFQHWKELNEGFPTSFFWEQNPKHGGEWASKIFAEFKMEQWTVQDFVAKLAKTRKSQRTRVKTLEHLEDIATGLAVRSYILQRAMESGLDEDLEVQSQIQRVAQDFLLRRWAGSVEDTVGRSPLNEGLLRKEFDANKDLYVEPLKVNASEILVRSQDQALALLNSLKGGAEFGEVARTHSVRVWAAKNRGELGFVPLNTFGDIAPEISRAKVGDVVGPFFVKPYFALYKILGRKGPSQRSFEEAREDVLLARLPFLKKKAFSDAVDAIRVKAKIMLDIVALGKVAVIQQ